ncbi:hypothetical protein R69749_00327 [Paraburkholderia domus]|nr:hypothetical protein R69749_00327 [Paraburkholderia domus]CAE6871351.1 hypothetical protein R70199_01673 [Paraburkholderia domus]
MSAYESDFPQSANPRASFRLQVHRARRRANRFPRRTASACAPVRHGCIHAGIDSQVPGLLANGPDVGIFLPRPALASPRQVCGASGYRWFRTGRFQLARKIQSEIDDLKRDREHRTTRTDRPRQLRQRDRNLMRMSAERLSCRPDSVANARWNARKNFQTICRTNYRTDCRTNFPTIVQTTGWIERSTTRKATTKRVTTIRTNRRHRHAGRPRCVQRWQHWIAAGPCVSRAGYSSSSATSAPAPAVTASAMAFTPSDSRIRFSISRAMSGFSRRNSRALSLP